MDSVGSTNDVKRKGGTMQQRSCVPTSADVQARKLTTTCRAPCRMAKELTKKASGLVSAISSVSTGGLSTRPSRSAYDEVPRQAQDRTLPANDSCAGTSEVLAERASRAGKLVGGISSGGLSTRSSHKAYEEVKSPFEEPRKTNASPLQTMGEDAEVIRANILANEYLLLSQ